MYWREDNIVYYVKGLDFNNKSKWEYICTCKDEDTADFIRNLLDFADNGFEDIESTMASLGRAISKLKQKPKTTADEISSLENDYNLLRLQVIM